MLTKKTNHVQEALGNLITKFQGKENFTTFLTALVNQIQDLEDDSFEVFENRWLLTAVGAQLDGLGQILGVDREGRDDDDYRTALIHQIQIIYSSGTPEDILTSLNNLFVASYRIKELGYAAFDVILEGENGEAIYQPSINSFLTLIDSVNPAGVRSFFQWTRHYPYRFQFSSSDSSEYDPDTGFANNSQTIGGYLDYIEEA